MRIILAIDIIGGKCVRLTRGDYSTGKVYSDDPVETAMRMEDNGIRYLHIVDLDGARQGKIMNLGIVEKIAGKTDLAIDFGGGVRSDDDIRSAFSSGAVQVTAGSIAVTDPDLFMKWLNTYGPDKLILGADHKNGIVSVSGWTEDSDTELITFLSGYQKKGVRYTVCTDIERDGMLKGPSAGLYREILASVNMKIIASGGISSLKDIEEIRASGCEAVIVGKAYYEGRITLKELAEC